MYFYHKNILNDQRRQLIDFLVISNLKQKKNYQLSELLMYLKDSSINEEIDKLVYGASPCLNIFEYKYHINNYKTQPCFYEENNIPCQYKHFCFYSHRSEIFQADLTKFANFYQECFTSNKVKKNYLNYWVSLLNSENNSNKFIENEISAENKNDKIQINSIILNISKNIKSSSDSSNTNNNKNIKNTIKNTAFPSILAEATNLTTPLKTIKRIQINDKDKDFKHQSIYKELKKIQSIKIGKNLFGSIPKFSTKYLAPSTWSLRSLPPILR